MNPFWLVRMAQWARNPPSLGRVILVAVVIFICLVLFGIERIWGWPEALTPTGGGRGGMPRF